MDITSETRKMAVIGDPIRHSMSPFIHNEIIREHDMDAIYMSFQIRSEDLKSFCEAMTMLDFSGFNVTLPHKKAIMECVDETDVDAEAFGAVNTVKVLRDGRLKGYNTDVAGMLMALAGKGIVPEGKSIMIIGAGGAAGALVKGFDAAGAASIRMINRTLEKAVSICEGVPSAEALEWSSKNMKKAADESDLIINCTSLGLAGMSQDFEDLTFLDRTNAFVCDLVYNPWETRFLAYARARGLDTMNGMDMLIYQGLIAFQIFMDVELDRQAEYERLLPICEEMVRVRAAERAATEAAEAEAAVRAAEEAARRSENAILAAVEISAEGATETIPELEKAEAEESDTGFVEAIDEAGVTEVVTSDMPTAMGVSGYTATEIDPPPEKTETEAAGEVSEILAERTDMEADLHEFRQTVVSDAGQAEPEEKNAQVPLKETVVASLEELEEAIAYDAESVVLEAPTLEIRVPGDMAAAMESSIEKLNPERIPLTDWGTDPE